mmetsp:Transcript_45079/g.109075  ORF Transcript_45079/g.109075 Transcript_45079/m.109075 type:complete len:107 (+) Transcript_45079:106-426(+)|eukprot:CAMPEP_0113629018 /NCGR_PEP_ID=MMETSP0017_2-20120614/15051_1 /TAXON_ID=2856 /ORGANISM="Cylindrotheca closterium" /LENGTH=106 /DNA_ID=CAMNT_0000539375 /DNA_START=72 /DNA_END=392 /DNA_ORIENTATION=- /assembly_acc=CAM_ASM_000147
MSSILSIVGWIMIMHSAYSCLHFRGILLDYDLQESVSIPPTDVYIEVGAGFLLLLISEIMGAGTFQTVDVLGPGKRRPLAAPGYKTRGFDIYENRSKALNKANKAS